MRSGIASHRTLWAILLVGFLLKALFLLPPMARAGHPLLIELITRHNLKAHERSLQDGTYRGEEGILRVRPDVAEALGMRVQIDRDYRDALALFDQAERFLEKAEETMAARRKETPDGEYARRILDYFLRYRKTREAAQERIMAYRTRLNPDMDERLNGAPSARVMGKLLHESLEKTDYRLRDALGRFHNACQGAKRQHHALSPENVEFVNGIFREFVRQAPKVSLLQFRLDKDSEYLLEGSPDRWKKVMERVGFPYVTALERAMEKVGNRPYKLDPLLFLALMKRESDFDPLAVSSVGAAGLTQIMPKTALDLGMTRIYSPSYFSEGLSLVRQERDKRRQAMRELFKADQGDGLKNALKARKLMQESLALAREKEKLFVRYRQDLLKRQGDDRLKPALAIEFGLKYFATLMKAQKGDISLALASYNAGPHPVVRYEGIPPFPETVRFRNHVLEFYREYLRVAKRTL